MDRSKPENKLWFGMDSLGGFLLAPGGPVRKGSGKRWADIDFLTPVHIRKNFWISISNPYLKISEI